MKTSTSPRGKWLVAGLAVVCVAALVRLLWSTGVIGAGLSRSSVRASPAASAHPGGRAAMKGPLSASAGLERYDPQLRLGLLDQLEARPLPGFERNPFQYGLTPEEKKVKEIRAQPPPPAPPPPPPPVTVKADGYSEAQGGVKTATLEDTTPGGQTYDVKEGDQFANRYKVLKITEVSVEIEDETYNRTVQLPYPQ